MPNRRWDCKSARIAARRHRPVCGREILASTRAGAWGAAGEILKPAGWQWATRWCAKPGFGLEQGFDAIRCFNSNSQHSADALPRRSNHVLRQQASRSQEYLPARFDPRQSGRGICAAQFGEAEQFCRLRRCHVALAARSATAHAGPERSLASVSILWQMRLIFGVDAALDRSGISWQIGAYFSPYK